MCGRRSILPAVLAAVLLAAAPAQAERLFGNANVSHEYLRREGIDIAQDSLGGVLVIDTSVSARSDNVMRESLVLSYEDALFTKNLMRLTANLQRREFPFLDHAEFQPIYYLDLRSYGYTVTARYSPYTRRSLAVGTGEEFAVHYRDWRSTAILAYPNFPTLSVVYSHLKNFDKLPVHQFGGVSRNWVIESGYTRGLFNLRGNYNNLTRRSTLPGGANSVTETWSGTVGGGKSWSEIAYVSTNYNYYDTRQHTAGFTNQDSRTHSVTSMASFTAVPNLNATASYSGRFTRSVRNRTEFDSDDQNFAARAEYTPFTYLTGFAGKGYQISGQGTGYIITEYLNLGATATRYFRSGVDTRLTYNRTIFQQSERTVSLIDDEGEVVGTTNDGAYALDTYHASLNFKPLPYIRTYLDLSVSRNNDPIDVNRRYQFTRSLDARVDFSRRVEGRVTVTSLYEGDVLKFGSAFSQNYNAGVTYIPRDNLNLNLTVIHNTYAGAVSSKTTSLTGYLSYSYRRAFSIYGSYNQRRETREREILLPGGVSEVDQRPVTLNGQLIMYLSHRATLSLAYIRNETDNSGGLRTSDESIQTVVTLQI